MKVYVLIVESTLSYDTNKKIKVFKNQKDAEEVFNKEVERAIADADEHWVIEESDMAFSIYDDGYYLINNITVSVSEKEVE